MPQNSEGTFLARAAVAAGLPARASLAGVLERVDELRRFDTTTTAETLDSIAPFPAAARTWLKGHLTVTRTPTVSEFNEAVLAWQGAQEQFRDDTKSVPPQVKTALGLAADASESQVIAKIRSALGLRDALAHAPLDKFQAKVAEKVKADTRTIDYGEKVAQAQREVSIEEPDLYAATRVRVTSDEAGRFTASSLMALDVRRRIAGGESWTDAVRNFSAEHPELAHQAAGYVSRDGGGQ
jgi:hypothetical protein